MRFIKLEKSNIYNRESLAEQERLRLHKERIKALSKPFSIEEDKRRKYHPSSKVGFVKSKGFGEDDWNSIEG